MHLGIHIRTTPGAKMNVKDIKNLSIKNKAYTQQLCKSQTLRDGNQASSASRRMGNVGLPECYVEVGQLT